MPWPFQTPGVTGFIDKAAGTVTITVVRSAVHESRIPLGIPPSSAKLCFANHLMLTWEPLIKELCLVDGTPIPEEVLETIRRTAEELTFDVHWLAGDLLMLDNRRFLHGRRLYREGDARDIVQIQSARASFAYGATMRQPVATRFSERDP